MRNWRVVAYVCGFCFTLALVGRLCGCSFSSSDWGHCQLLFVEIDLGLAVDSGIWYTILGYMVSPLFGMLIANELRWTRRTLGVRDLAWIGVNLMLAPITFPLWVWRRV